MYFLMTGGSKKIKKKKFEHFVLKKDFIIGFNTLYKLAAIMLSVTFFHQNVCHRIGNLNYLKFVTTTFVFFNQIKLRCIYTIFTELYNIISLQVINLIQTPSILDPH